MDPADLLQPVAVGQLRSITWPWRLDREKRALILVPRLTRWETVPFLLTPAAFSIPMVAIIGVIVWGFSFGPAPTSESRSNAIVMVLLCGFMLSVAWIASYARLCNAREAAEKQALRTPVLLRLTPDAVELPAAGERLLLADALAVQVREFRTLPGLHFYTPLLVTLEAGPAPTRSIPLGWFDGRRAMDAEDFAEAARELLGLPAR